MTDRWELMHIVGNPRYAEFGGLTEKEIAYKVMGDILAKEQAALAGVQEKK